MSKIDELIEKLCPNGVEFKTINDVCNKILSGGTPKTTNKDYYSGNIPWLRSGEINFNEITDTEIKITEKGLNASSAKWIKPKSVLIALTGATVARSAVNEIAITANQSVCAMEVSEIINYKYLYYTIANMYHEIKKKAQGILTSINLSIIKSIKIPVPPLEIQCEIVRILDKFSSCSTGIIALLKAELKARKQQYEYYREKLLTFEEENIPRKRLIDVSKISRGKRVTKKELNNSNKYPVYQNSLAPMGYYNDYNYEKNKTYIISAGSAGEIGFCKENFWAADDCLVIYDLKNLLDKFVYYYLLVKQNYILFNVRRAAIPRLPRKIIEEIEIPIPPIEKQKEIVNVLDRFNTLCNDLTEGIPAEIEARQKQYEYYRDKLLTFKELNKE